MTSEDIIKKLHLSANPAACEGMARFGINTRKALGVSLPNIRKLAREAGKDHSLALCLWEQDLRETRILASMVDIPAMVTEQQMEQWAAEFDSWEVCDQVCSNLFVHTPFAYQKAVEWCTREEEFVKRAAFAIMACMAVKNKKASDASFEPLFPLITGASTDNRNFVKKAVNWALRQIGKRNETLNAKAIACAKQIQVLKNKTASWIAADALRELESPAVQLRLKTRSQK